MVVAIFEKKNIHYENARKLEPEVLKFERLYRKEKYRIILSIFRAEKLDLTYFSFGTYHKFTMISAMPASQYKNILK